MAAAAFYMNAGDPAAAVPHLQAASRMSSRVFPWIALGDAATLSGRFGLAHRAYDRAARIDPGNALTVRGRSQLLIAEGKYAEAERLLKAWQKRYPQNYRILAQLGTLYILQNRARQAIGVLEPAVKMRPELGYQHALLGEAYAKDRHLEKAIAEMREAVRIDGTLADAWGKLGLYLIKLTRYQEGREPLERAIALDPMGSHYYWAMGDSYMLERADDEHFTRGEQYYQQALRLDPENEEALYSYGMALMRRGRREDMPLAIDLFKRLVKINPRDMNAYYTLAEAYRTLGKTREAKAHEAKFQQLFAKGRDRTRSSYLSMAFRDTAPAHLKLGREAMARRDYTLAAKEFQFALQRDRLLKEARQGLLEAQKRSGQSAAVAEDRPGIEH